MTSTGLECLPKFSHFGQMINGCVDDRPSPWCAVESKSEVESIENQDLKDVCLADWGKINIYTTFVTINM